MSYSFANKLRSGRVIKDNIPRPDDTLLGGWTQSDVKPLGGKGGFAGADWRGNVPIAPTTPKAVGMEGGHMAGIALAVGAALVFFWVFYRT
jgi:hypothetical protein